MALSELWFCLFLRNNGTHELSFSWRLDKKIAEGIRLPLIIIKVRLLSHLKYRPFLLVIRL